MATIVLVVIREEEQFESGRLREETEKLLADLNGPTPIPQLPEIETKEHK